MELVIAIVGFVLVGVLLVISIAIGLTRQGGTGKWVTATAAALVGTVGLLSYI